MLTSTLKLPTSRIATLATLLGGLRAGMATVLPILAAYATARPILIWAAMGGWLSTFADTGGAYRARARHLAAFAVGGAVSCFVGALAARAPLTSVVLVFVWAAGGALLRLFGDAATSVGSLLAVTFVASLGTATDVRGAAARAALLLAGCAWAMLLTLFVWPLRPWQPARRTIAACYDLLAGYARGMAAAIASAPNGGAPWHDLALREHAAIRTAIETARVTFGETRRTRVGSSRRGEDLVVLLESAELLFETLVAAADQVEATARAASDRRAGGTADAQPSDDRLVHALVDAVDAVGDALTSVADSIPVIGRWRASPPPTAHRADRAIVALWEAAETEHDPSSPRATAARNAAALLEHAVTLVDTGAEAAASLLSGGQAPAGTPRAPAQDLDADLRAAQPAPWTVLRANLTPDSLAMRHAMRVAVVAAVATWLGAVARLPHATWVTTTALIVLQPYAGLTQRRGLERLTWTLLGGLVSALLAAVVRDRLAIGAIMFPLAVASIAVRASHYGLFTFFLTPVFVLLAEPAAGDWSVALVRGLDTLLGGALALVASRVLWPSWEYRRLPSELGRMLDALRGFFRAVEWRAVGAESASQEQVAAARRAVGLASNNVDAAIQRFLGEPPGRVADVESLMTMLTFVRRMAGALTTIAVSGGGLRPTSAEHLVLARALDVALADLGDAVREERAPPPLPEPVARLAHRRADPTVPRDRRALRSTHELPAVGVGLERLARQVGVLHAAAARVYAG
ncbi:hypothetical protein J421_4048 [Gemmatirosa kalamazoonensis]|uniref:Integral membrane bound transporter domain-containing protein n=1 Tax=Gemmatirosa kalamazoonensis TaxID=861299 RepID=W0RMM9_9BACT|nr:hypothetical protein J421_4048 [Gemmatirosa kalamazoonensis]